MFPSHRIVVLACTGFLGCASDNRIEDVHPAPKDGVLERIFETGVGSVAAVAHHRTVLGGLDGLRLDDPLGALTTLAPTGSVLAAAEAPDGGLLVATDDDVLDVTDYVGRARLAEAVTLPLRALATDGTDLWLRGGDGVQLWRDGWLHRIEVAHRPADGPFAVRDGRLWLGSDKGIFALEDAGATWKVVVSHDATGVEAVAVDGDGTLYAAADGDLVTYDGTAWRTRHLPSPVHDVRAHPATAGAWLLTEAGVVRVDGDTLDGFAAAPAPDDASADQAGRLLIASGGALVRLSATRGGVIVGVDEGESLTDVVDVRLLPTEAADVDTVTATLDGADLAVSDTPWTIHLDPDPLPSGDHVLAAHARWSDGAEADLLPVHFTTPAPLTVTWAHDIDPLRQAHCALCHDGDTKTLLDTKERWQAKVDDILTETTAQRMPLTGKKLTGAELDLIRAWKDGGFP